MSSRPLVPAEPTHVRAALSGAMRRSMTGQRHPSYEQTTDLAAQTLVEELERQGFVVMRKAPVEAHTAPAPNDPSLSSHKE